MRRVSLVSLPEVLAMTTLIVPALKAAWYWVFGEPTPHVHEFWSCFVTSYDTRRPAAFLSRCACGKIGPHICQVPGGSCIWCDPRIVS